MLGDFGEADELMSGNGGMGRRERSAFSVEMMEQETGMEEWRNGGMGRRERSACGVQMTDQGGRGGERSGI